MRTWPRGGSGACSGSGVGLMVIAPKGTRHTVDVALARAEPRSPLNPADRQFGSTDAIVQHDGGDDRTDRVHGDGKTHVLSRSVSRATRNRHGRVHGDHL